MSLPGMRFTPPDSTVQAASFNQLVPAAASWLPRQAFDELLLLQHGGRTLFNGPLGPNSVHLIDYFTTAVPAVDPPEGDLNPATWMLDISAVGGEETYGVSWADVYAESELRRWVVASTVGFQTRAGGFRKAWIRWWAYTSRRMY